VEPKAGDIADITPGQHRHRGKTVVVLAVDGVKATVRLIDDTTEQLTPFGEAFSIHVRALSRLPSPTEVRAAKVQYRANHLANLPNPKAHPKGFIREYPYTVFFEFPGWDT